ncbi:uncharacterized protein DNG_05459 [Cephalotrichum gorgonifer]|uniref:Uncharacterized protein n=1 Tax=Cephalotrichum gorgonifer TaxID=2041049 RepID=A0AAE8MZX5_9PEZI|nr:uncharacterized protein DNG_05459 [Cephalotrichum gorgonifer]
MVRKAASEGPSLFCEWAVGTTVNSAMRKLRQERLEKEREDARRKRDVIKVEVMTDDESETESVRVTYPRGGKDGTTKGAGKASTGAKQVRFERRPLKPALKKKGRRRRGEGSSGSDTLVSGSELGTDSRSVDTSQPSGSEGYTNDSTSSRRSKTRRSRQSKSTSSEDTDAVYDSDCSDCEKDIASKREKARKLRDKYSNDTESSTESEKADREKKHMKRKHSKKKHSSRRSGSGSPKKNQLVFDSDSEVESEEKLPRSKKRGHKNKVEVTSPKIKVSSSTGDRVDQKVYPEAMPGPHIRRPNLIRPIRAEVMQVEHAVEGPEDPRPNAFIDERNNIVRVYHGPAYGNPLGKLYPRRDPSLRPLPVGVPHPLENPYYHGFRSNQEQLPTGHMPTTLAVPYPSVPAAVPPPLGPVPGPEPYGSAEQPKYTAGLWGLGQNGHTIGTKETAKSWSNNVGPQPSASLREANRTSRWEFSKGGSRKFSGGSQKGREDGSGWGNDNPNTGGWDNSGNADRNAGGNGNSWKNAHAGKTNGGWSPPNNQDGAGSTWGDGNENTWNAANNENITQWDSNSQKNGNGSNDFWGTAATTNNDDDWGTGANDNASNKSASNNVGFSAPPNSGSPPRNDQDNNVYGGARENYMPGSWNDSPAAGGDVRTPDWRDPTAAQSTKPQGGW